MVNRQNMLDTIAREKLAMDAERTLSAWFRTGLAAIVAGFGIIRLLTFKNPLHRLLAYGAGQILLLWGIIIFIVAFRNYQRVTAELAKHNIQLFNRLIWFVVPLCLVGILLFLVIARD